MGEHGVLVVELGAARGGLQEDSQILEVGAREEFAQERGRVPRGLAFDERQKRAQARPAWVVRRDLPERSQQRVSAGVGDARELLRRPVQVVLEGVEQPRKMFVLGKAGGAVVLEDGLADLEVAREVALVAVTRQGERRRVRDVAVVVIAKHSQARDVVASGEWDRAPQHEGFGVEEGCANGSVDERAAE